MSEQSEATVLTTEPIDRSQIDTTTADVIGSTYGIELNDRFGLRFRCGQPDEMGWSGQVEHAMLLNAELKPGSYRATLAAQKMIAAVVLSREGPPATSAGRFDGWWAVRMLVLTEPVAGDVEVTIHRSDGQIVATGRATAIVHGAGLRLRLRHVTTERAELAIDGTITDDEITIEPRIATGGGCKNSGRLIEL
ncbi:MAG: hypothetical protein ACR2QK_03515 [Acidimicrobiales bacterium]